MQCAFVCFYIAPRQVGGAGTTSSLRSENKRSLTSKWSGTLNRTNSGKIMALMIVSFSHKMESTVKINDLLFQNLNPTPMPKLWPSLRSIKTTVRTLYSLRG